MNGRQSFTRGITIMKLLAENGSMSASALAKKLELNQSSVSRLLRSLVCAGFVYKPSFQKFKLDYGILMFAGVAMNNFPLVSASVQSCNSLHQKTGLGVAITLLHDERLLYMARIFDRANSSLSLINDSNFPVYKSSLGLALSYQLGRDYFKKLITKSLLNHGSSEEIESKLYATVQDSFAKYGFLYMINYENRRLNAAGLFKYEETIAAIAIYSDSVKISPQDCRQHLLEGINLLGEPATPHTSFFI